MNPVSPRRGFVGALAVGLLIASISSVRGQNSYTNSNSGRWDDPNNWSFGGTPQAGEDILIGNAGTKGVFIDSFTDPNTLTINSLTLSAPTGSVNTLFLSDAETNTPLVIQTTITIANGGALAITNAALQVDGGGFFDNAIDGELTVNNGSITINSIGIGTAGSGTLTLNDGRLASQYVFVGVNSGSEGMLNVGGGVVQFSGLFLQVSYHAGSTGTVLVTGGEIATSNPFSFLAIGGAGLDEPSGFGQMTVSNGEVHAGFALIGAYPDPGFRSKLTLAGGTFDTARMDVDNGQLVISGGEFVSTLYPGSGLYLAGATMTLSDGSVLVNRFEVFTGETYADTIFEFKGGILRTKGTSYQNGLPCIVGDGVGNATMNFLGGDHAFPPGLIISANAQLTGCGTIEGSVTIDPGGTVLADCGDTLSFTGAVTNNGILFASNNTLINFYGSVVNNGLMDFTNGCVQFFSTLEGNGTLLATCTNAPPGRTSTNSWINGTGKWEDPLNWSLEVPPASTQSIFINNDFTKTVSIDSVTASSSPDTMTINSLALSGSSGVNTLSLANTQNGPPLHVLTTLNIGPGAVLAVNNSSLQVDGSGFSDNNIDGELTLDSGSITLNTINLGITGNGTLTVNSGLLNTRDILVGVAAGTESTFRLTGGTVQSAGFFELGFNAGSTGIALMTGGKLILPGFMTLGDEGLGQMTVSGGVIRAETLTMGLTAGSRGELTLAGGSLEALFGISMGFQSSIVVDGGQLACTNFGNIGLDIGTGTIIVSNGTVIVSKFTVGTNSASRGELDLIGGSFTVLSALPNTLRIGDALDATGVVMVTGGALLATNASTLVGSLGVGEMVVSSGMVMTSQTEIGSGANTQGSLMMSGGTMIVDSNLTVAASPGSTGVVMMTGGELTVTNAPLVIGANGGHGELMLTSTNSSSLRPVRRLKFPRPLTVSGGGGSVLRAQSITVAAGSTGMLMIDDGTATVLQDVLVGAIDSATGTVAVGTSLVIGGNFELRNNPKLECHICGYESGKTFGHIDVTGTATFAGELSARFLLGFENQITNGASFTVLTAGSITGAFANVASGHRLGTENGTGSFIVNYNGNELVLEDFRAGPVDTLDLAVVTVKAPRTVKLSAGSSVTRRVKVQIQNRSSQDKQIDTLTGLVSLVAESLATNCPNAQVVLHAGKPNPPTPLVLKPGKKLSVFFDVTFDCANDGAKGIGHEDFRYEATLNPADQDSSNDVCPRPPGADDTGCAEVKTDVVVK
jgi:hypothetical protein